MARIPKSVKFVLVFGIGGFILSFLTGLISNISFGTVLLRALVFLLVFAGVGFGFYQLIQWKFEELAAVIQGEESISSAESNDSGGGDAPINGAEDSMLGGDKSTYGSSSASDSASSFTPTGKRAKDGHFGDHIIVEGVKLENEPKLMAEAIRTIMSKDKDE